MAGGIVQNHSRAKKSDAGQNPLDHSPDRVLVGGERTIGRSEDDDRGNGRAETNQSVGPQAGGFPVQLAVQSENGADKQRRAQTQGDFFISA